MNASATLLITQVLDETSLLFDKNQKASYSRTTMKTNTLAIMTSSNIIILCLTLFFIR
ncbi:hypothetical protein CLAVI_000534 [Candidatus Clavichlamydia salmonicola]|uniref:hypothetical protein n=1 Tax=Candidatus Clavichlamydia salmonicola TaxID=469812 RepID=UPI001891509C|nr:hypothetical protein [Candidatus Clavichlamydia salmonicola]MBF5050912.1 hypothetical protein [Candidatus Clavichlamydia salmonicola]